MAAVILSQAIPGTAASGLTQLDIYGNVSVINNYHLLMILSTFLCVYIVSTIVLRAKRPNGNAVLKATGEVFSNVLSRLDYKDSDPAPRRADEHDKGPGDIVPVQGNKGDNGNNKGDPPTDPLPATNNHNYQKRRRVKPNSRPKTLKSQPRLTSNLTPPKPTSTENTSRKPKQRETNDATPHNDQRNTGASNGHAPHPASTLATPSTNTTKHTISRWSGVILVQLFVLLKTLTAVSPNIVHEPFSTFGLEHLFVTNKVVLRPFRNKITRPSHDHPTRPTHDGVQRTHDTPPHYDNKPNYNTTDTHDPMKARHVGEAPHPGPDNEKILCRLLNVKGGGRLKAEHLAQTDAHVTCFTELELADYAVPDFRSVMRDNGMTITLAPSISITKDTDKFIGRRAGILSKTTMDAEILLITNEDGLDELTNSGRWVEIQVPCGHGNHYVTLAVYYGLAGKTPAERTMNERLLAQALSRATADPDAPYILFTDANTTIKKSSVLTTMIKASLIIDVHSDHHDLDERMPTFISNSITEPILLGDKGSSAIDYVLANQPGMDVIESIQFRWDLAIEDGLDHVPIDVILNDHAYRRYIDILAPAIPIDLESLVALSPIQKQQLYCKIRERYNYNWTRMCETDSSNIAHEQWSLLAENFLRAWAMMQDKNEDLDTLVNAFTYIDAETQNEASRKYSRRGHMQRIKTQAAVKDVSRGSLNARDYIGSALNKLASQCKALILRIGRSTDTTQVPSARTTDRCVHGSTCPIMCPDCNHLRSGKGPMDSCGDSADSNGDYESRAIAQKIRSNATALLDTDARIVTRLHDGANLLDKDIVSAVAEETYKEVKKHVKERHAERASKWTKRMCQGWKKNAAQAFFRFLRNDNKTPLRSFHDPQNEGKLTSDTRRVEELFGDTWRPIFNRPDSEPPPDWEHFEARYKDHLTPLDPVKADDFQAKELAAQAAKFKKRTVGGIDAWLPAEQRLLPLEAWEDRTYVERTIRSNGTYPDVYYQVPMPMLRKGKGRTPKEHRGLSIFVTSYRLTSGAWWTRIKEPLKPWLHGASCGGIADHECIEMAWDSQLAIEVALLTRTEHTQINTDYEKFFDTFNPRFFYMLLLAIGLPKDAATLLLDMYTKICRRIKIGKHIGKAFASNRGFGQGDSLSLFAALVITTIQFRYINAHCPNVKLGSVIDDRNFRGPCCDVIKAVQLALR